VTDYPEHDKMEAVQEESQAIGLFLDTMGERFGWHLAEWGPPDEDDLDDEPRLYTLGIGIEEVLARYFGIDRNKIEAEKREMLRRQQEVNRLADERRNAEKVAAGG
jgi:hypothetical protein